MDFLEWHALTEAARKYQFRGRVRNAYRYIMRKYVKPNSKILEFGCGDCPFYGMIKKENIPFQGYGVDIVKRTNEYPIYSSIRKVPHNDFDLVVLHHVVEHLPYKDSFKNMRSLVKKMKRGGG